MTLTSLPPTGESALDEGWHLCRSWTPPDPYAPACGCVLLPCGHVDSMAVPDDCPQHAMAACKSMRSGHRPSLCPGSGSEINHHRYGVDDRGIQP